MTPPATRLVVMPSQNGLRIDQFLAAATSLSRRAARSVITDGGVARNGRPTRVQSRTVELGDVVDVLRPAEELGVSPHPELPEVEILHDDRWLMAVAKPVGMLSQPGSRPTSELALDQLVALRLALREGSRRYLRMVHRLDRLTSGVALFARNPHAHAPLVESWARGGVVRRYTAIVEGHPSPGSSVIDQPIARDRGHDWRFRVSSGGKKARTEVRVVTLLDDELAVVECLLHTGRTHQVRVHLADWGHPVAGDRLYGAGRIDVADRPLLHASSLRLPHPKDGSVLEITAPPPEDIARFIFGDMT
jgi:23S rRNA pseudouridine1911/1915/1917 synthase